MSASGNKKKRPTPTQTPVSTAQPNVIHSLLDSYDFLASNEYSEKTIGIQAFLLRKGVGDINFSDIIDDSERRTRQGQTSSYTTILEDKRSNLPEIDASIEKCMMLTRLTSYINDNTAHFTALLSDIRLEMQYSMADSQAGQPIINFQKRLKDFNVRRTAQEKRRLFFFDADDLGKPANLVYLQNRTTEHLNYLLAQKPNSKLHQSLKQDFETIFKTSFLIVTQPHSGVNPITIYERRRAGEYTAKISVTIISLLHDFIEQHPNLIELVDIEPSLHPTSTHYKLVEPQTISWKQCQIQPELSGRARTFLCAELSTITIEQAAKNDTRVRFAQLLHSLKFAIKIHFHSAEFKIPIFECALDSLQFAIGAHNNQIPQLLTRVLLDDIRYFTENQRVDVKTILNFIIRYFIHRTGVYPNDCVKTYLEQELTKATTQRNTFNAIEDIYLDFLVNFVYQVEFMAKHPILSMFHADGLFLSICNSERAAEAMIQSSVVRSPVIALRFNSIRIDYTSTLTQQAVNRAIKLQPCAIRVDIYNDRTKKLQNRTFDSSVLANDISKFVSSASSETAAGIRILSKFDDRSNERDYRSFTDFGKYYHPRLQQICKSDEKYRPVTDLVENANVGNTDEDIIDNSKTAANNFLSLSPYPDGSLPHFSPGLFDFESSSDTNSMQEFMNVSYENTNGNLCSPSSSIVSPAPSAPIQNNHEIALKQFIETNPDLVEQILRQYHTNNFSNTVPLETQTQTQTQIQYQISPSSFPVQTQLTIPQQRSTIQFIQQPIYHQPQVYSQTQMQFAGQQQPTQMFTPQQQPTQMFTPQQQPTQTFAAQQVIFQQRPAGSSVIHYVPNNSYPAFTTQFAQQTQSILMYQNQPTNENTNISQQQQQSTLMDQTILNDDDLQKAFADLSPTTAS